MKRFFIGLACLIALAAFAFSASPNPQEAALQANRTVNLNQVGGTAVDSNSGNKSAGTLRVVLATDQPQLTNSLKVDGSGVTQPVSGTVSATPAASATVGGCTPTHLISGATTNATSVKGSAGQLYLLVVSNVNASARFFKLSDSASAPTCGTTAVVQTYTIPGATTGAGFVVPIPVGMSFANGIGFCITGAMADNDTTAIGAGDVAVSACYK